MKIAPDVGEGGVGYVTVYCGEMVGAVDYLVIAPWFDLEEPDFAFTAVYGEESEVWG